MTQKDELLIEEAMETTYASTVKRLMREADTEECKSILMDILSECTE